MSTRRRRERFSGSSLAPVGAAALTTACTTPAGRSGTIERPAPREESKAWVDSVIAGMSLRQKVAQMVWPFMLGDYAPTTAPAWRELERLARDEEVGGFIV